MPSFPVLHSCPEFAQNHVHWISDAIQPPHPLSSPSPPAFSLSQHQGYLPVSQLFTSGGQSIGASASASVLQVSSKLISFRIDWFDLHAVQRTCKSSPAPLFKSISSSTSAFFMVQLSHLYVITGKTIALTRRTFESKVMSLPFNMLSRFIIAFLARKHLLILWLQSPSTVILEPKKIKSVTVSTFPPSICHEVMGLNAMILVF